MVSVSKTKWSVFHKEITFFNKKRIDAKEVTDSLCMQDKFIYLKKSKWRNERERRNWNERESINWLSLYTKKLMGISKK